MTHWYSKTGAAVYQVPAKRGGYRDTTLRDARELGLAPGVTDVIRAAGTPAGLVTYLREQSMLAALTLPRRPDESESDWLERVRRDADAQAEKARDRGTAIHQAVENGLQGIAPPLDMQPYVRAVKDALQAHFGPVEWRVERTFYSAQHGYGGKIDMMGAGRIVDLKTIDKPLSSARLWPEHLQQIAAYGVGLGLAPLAGGICFLSIPEERAIVVEATTPELGRGWEMFAGLLAYWRAANKYDPRAS